MRYILSAFFLLAIAAIPSVVWAQRIDQLPAAAAPTTGAIDEHIAVVVNDSIISTSDVRERIAMGLLSSGFPDNEQIRQKILPQILHTLIDEQLEMQEAKKQEITVSQDEIDQALARIAEENHIPGDMKTYVTQHGVSADALISQVRAGIAWNKVVQRELRPRVDVGDDEVDAAVERIRANAGKEEFLVSEIFLAVDNPKEEDQVKQFAENLVQQLKSGGNFGEIARQFSQSTGAATGGDIGWIQEGQLSPELNKALVATQTGEVVGPIRASNGYHILGVREKRTIALGDVKDMSINLQQAFRPFGNNPNKEALLRESDQLRSSITDCNNLSTKLAQQFPLWHWQDLGEVKLDKAPSWLVNKVRDLPVNKSSDAMATDKGALILFVCGRKIPDNIDRTAILNSIGTEKLELQARRLLRDLRREAYLDVKLTTVP